MSSAPTLPACTTFYNGACPVCRLEIAHYRRLDDVAGGRLGWTDVTREPEALAAFGLERMDVLRRLHVVDGQGRVHVGVDAFLVLWRTMPRYRRLAGFVGARAVKPVATFVYDRLLAPTLFAWNRARGRI
jgi:predicted DCC family thiol-disulfide oxidoreductase YuxK